MRVVLVDDAVFMRRFLKDIISSLGHHIIAEGCNGHEAIALAKAYKPDVMTLDVTMPELDGVSALSEILSVSPSSKIIMISAMGQHPIVFDSIKRGAYDFIVKPFKKERIEQIFMRLSS